MENSFIENIISKDKEALVYLNNLGSEQWDGLWLFITNQFNWVPLFLFLFYILFKKLGTKKAVFTILFIALLVAFSDMFTNFVKDSFMRLRPNNDPSLDGRLRHLINPQSYSFWSGHAATSTIVTTFLILLLKKYTKYIYWLILFPAVFAYSRLYLGVHFPVDIFVGITAGVTFGIGFYKLYTYTLLENKLFVNE